MTTPEAEAERLLPCAYPASMCGGALKVDKDYHWEFCRAASRPAVAAALAAVEQKQRERDAEIAKNYYSDDGLYGLTDAESKIAIGIANAILAKPEAK